MKKIKKAMLLASADTVATLLEPAECGDEIRIFGDVNEDQIEIRSIDSIPRGHKIALQDFTPGEAIIKYGQIIGVASTFIQRGAHVHVHNVDSQRGRGNLRSEKTDFSRSHTISDEAGSMDRLVTSGVRPGCSAAAADGSDTSGISENRSDRLPPYPLMLYKRADGRYGVRNRIAIIPSVACVNHIAEKIASEIPIADAYTHPYGCDQLGGDLDLSFRCLAAMGTHPNVGAVLVIGLGCEEILPHELYEEIHSVNPLSDVLVMQEVGGTTEMIRRGCAVCHSFEQKLQEQKRVAADSSALIIGLECGGSDFTSGIASNPAVGNFTERICRRGGKAVFGETTELMGSENILKTHIERDEVYRFITEKINRIEKTASDLHVDLRGTQPSPGNIEGGLCTIEEKSLGGVMKIGREKIQDGIPFGSRAVASGVTFVDTPGNDLACSLGLAAAGAQIIIFTTGRGTPMGFSAAPVIKVTANEWISNLMAENFDLDLSDIVSGTMSVSDGGRLLFDRVMRTASGEETASERLGHREFSLYRISPILT